MPLFGLLNIPETSRFIVFIQVGYDLFHSNVISTYALTHSSKNALLHRKCEERLQKKRAKEIQPMVAL